MTNQYQVWFSRNNDGWDIFWEKESADQFNGESTKFIFNNKKDYDDTMNKWAKKDGEDEDNLLDMFYDICPKLDNTKKMIIQEHTTLCGIKVQLIKKPVRKKGVIIKYNYQVGMVGKEGFMPRREVYTETDGRILILEYINSINVSNIRLILGYTKIQAN